MRYGITEDYEYNASHKRKRIIVNLGYGEKVRVECPVERTDANYMEQDKAINEALNKHRLEYLRSQINAERISTYELIELQGLTEYIDSGDVQLLEWAGVPEFPEDEEESYKPNGKRIL